MIQDIAPSRMHIEYDPVTPAAGDTVFIFRGKQVLVKDDQDGIQSFPVVQDLKKPGLMEQGHLQFLFRIDENAIFLFMQEHGADLQPADMVGEEKNPYRFASLMEIRGRTRIAEMFACMTAFHLFTWYDKSRFCGRCGEKMVHADRERMMRCPACGNMVFPVIAPAVIVGVSCGEKLLMTKYAGREYTGWALIAGFCEIGETVEDTVRREVFEEAGIQIKNLRYVRSQPWGSDSNLLLGVFCEAEGDTSIHMDREELARAVWVDRADVPDMKDNHSLTGYMIDLFRTGKDREYR